VTDSAIRVDGPSIPAAGFSIATQSLPIEIAPVTYIQ
jgi:hypothetical protein